MTSQQRANMYADAAAELKAKIKLMKEQKKGELSNEDKNSEKDI